MTTPDEVDVHVDLDELDTADGVADDDWAPRDSGVVRRATPRDEELREDDEVVIPLTRPRTGSWRAACALPAWVPDDRLLGGFYLERAIGDGATADVLVATRASDAEAANAPRYALKVPDGAAFARQGVSSTAATQMFRAELSTLMALPEHPNLPRLAAFDGTGSKPFLAMDLVDGTGCDELIEAGGVSMSTALVILDGILAGLEALHATGIGHLDLKPANVVVTDGDRAVLVDFGLAGRTVRPRFLTASYGAPEVWADDDPRQLSPAAADIYSFGCVAYELLTGEVLFDAPTTTALVLAHASHDGVPPGVAALACKAHDVAVVLRRCLRHDPAERASASELRGLIRGLAVRLCHARWPL
jgi:eukaryotic-like serine/threonine-protein kinase